MRSARLLLVLGVLGLTTDVASQVSPPPATRAASSAAPGVLRYFDRIRNDPPALRTFLRAFPKGADLHNHLTGAVYAESYIRSAAALPLCIDVTTLTYVDAATGSPQKPEASRPVSCADPAAQRPASDVLQDPVLYRRAIDAMSTRNWNAARGSGHDQFFDTFVRFDAVAREGRDASAALIGRAVAEITHRAALQNIEHLELMLSFNATADVPSADATFQTDEQFAAMRGRLLDAAMRERIAERRRWLDSVQAAARTALGCGTSAAIAGCATSVRFMPFALRGFPPSQVFAQLLIAFELAAADARIAGVNLVMPEDWYVPMRDHELHMRMLRFFRTSYPTVRVALHAGELSFGLVPPEQLGIHVRQAIEIAGAERIGHGTDVMYDRDPSALLREMARRRIPVEISLSSSDIILNVRGRGHPMRQYLAAAVPVVLATDDEAVARSDLTNEYQRAVEEQGASYLELKQISRNSLEYSFLPADEKARVRGRLEAAFTAFEARYR